jgi:hypothetical protein
MTVTPEGVEDVSPASAVVSFFTPDKTKHFDQDVILNFCNYVLNFASRESAERCAPGPRRLPDRSARLEQPEGR